MGFTPPRKLYVLDFTGTELDGLIIKTVAISTGDFLELQQLVEDVKRGLDAVPILSPRFIAVVREWNLTDDDGLPVPVSEAGFLSLELTQMFAVLDAWQSVWIGVSAPLDRPSSDGAPSLVESLPMEPLSDSRAS